MGLHDLLQVGHGHEESAQLQMRVQPSVGANTGALQPHEVPGEASVEVRASHLAKQIYECVR
eukprot:11513530-Alexandrium_andersonii.AAC.1